MIGTENKTGHLSNVRSHRKQPFKMVGIPGFEVPLSAKSSRSLHIVANGLSRATTPGSVYLRFDSARKKFLDPTPNKSAEFTKA